MIAASKRAVNNMDDATDIPARMAEAILSAIAQRGRCGILDLKAKGFSLDDIARYWPEATAIAEDKTKRQLPCLPKE